MLSRHMVLVAFGLTSLATAQSLEWRQCPANGRLYAVTLPVTWQQAQSFAVAVGGELAQVRSAAEHDWLYQTFGGAQCLWIGLTDDGTEGNWRRTGGGSIPYTNWATGQPDNAGGAENWAALSPRSGLWYGADGRWVDLPGLFACPGIVELDPVAIGRAVAAGDGCVGSNGVPSLDLATGALPAPGAHCQMDFHHLPLAPTFVLATLGLPRATPLDLGMLGMVGCAFATDPVFWNLVLAPSGSGAVGWTFPVPNFGPLQGVVVHVQGVVADPAANQPGATVTNALALVFGPSVGEVAFTESFVDDSFLDRARSGGEWGAGQARFAAIGGDGRHGTFAPELGASLGVINGKRTFSFDTNATTIPAERTLTGVAMVVTDGHYQFDEMVVPADVRLRFHGSVPPVFTVGGRIEILGEIDVAGGSLTAPPLVNQVTGQIGASGGVFGGGGGQGGDKCLGTGYLPNYDGRNGLDARLLAGHAYAASAAGSGGRGSHVFPLSGLSVDLIYHLQTGVNYTPSAAAGGGGAGLFLVGGIGQVLGNNHVDPILGVPPRLDAMGPVAPGGTAVQLLPKPAGARSSAHFLVGGAGGGGGGSQATFCIAAINPRQWAPGCGGGGGGGAIALRAGDSLFLDGLAAVRANGGSGANMTGVVAAARPAPGGGGSGGSVVLQAGRQAQLQGLIDVRGGQGGTLNCTAGSLPPSGAAVQSEGGDGAPGFVRCEVPGAPTTALLPGMLPAAVVDNVAPLQETDDRAVMQSTFHATHLRFAPRYLRYEIDAVVDGLAVRFSDDPAVSTLPAGPGAPLLAWFQGAALDPVTGQPAVLGAWRTSVRGAPGQPGLAADAFDAFRFRLVVDRAVASDVVVKRVVVVYGT